MWDAIAAISAASGVVVATVLGLLAVKIARKSIIRSELEYRAERADKVLEKAAEISRLSGEYKAALHVFWKEPVAEVRHWVAEGDAEEADHDTMIATRLNWLVQERGTGEQQAHVLDSALSGAAGEFRALVRATGVSPDKSERVFALLDLVRGSARAQYLSLIPDVPWGVEATAENYGEQMLTAMASEILNFVRESEVHHIKEEEEVVNWFRERLHEGATTPLSPEQVSVNFDETFVHPEWDKAYAELVASTHEEALTTP